METAVQLKLSFRASVATRNLFDSSNGLINQRMKLFEYIERINLLHKLIKEKRTGCPRQLAKRLHISKGRVYQLIEELRLREAPIAYSRTLETYYYTTDYEINITFSLRPLTNTEMLNTNAGFAIDYNLQLFYSL